MANQLKMVQVHTIEGLRRLGWSYRRIARELGIHRETVRNYVLRLEAETQNRPNLTPGKPADLSPSRCFMTSLRGLRAFSAAEGLQETRDWLASSD